MVIPEKKIFRYDRSTEIFAWKNKRNLKGKITNAQREYLGESPKPIATVEDIRIIDN